MIVTQFKLRSYYVIRAKIPLVQEEQIQATAAAPKRQRGTERPPQPNGDNMKVVVVHPPRAVAAILARVFKIKK